MVRLFSALAIAVTLISNPALAQSSRWDGGGNNNFFETAENWLGDIPPDPTEFPQLIFTGATRPTPVAQTPWEILGMILGSDEADFVLSGQELRIRGFGIRNQSSRVQTVTNPLTLVRDQLWASGGLLRILGDVNLSNNVVTIVVELGQAGVTEIAGTASLGFIDIDAGAKLKLSGQILCDVDNLGGTLIIATDVPQPAGSTMQFGDGSTLAAEGDHACQLTLQLTGETTFSGGGSLALTGGLRGSGSLVVDGDGTLGLGSGYLFTFTGPVAVNSGRLELLGAQPGVPMLSGPITLGDGIGSANDAVLYLAEPGIVQTEFGWIPVIASDALLEIDGDHVITEMVLEGGQFICHGTFQTEIVTVNSASRTAYIYGAWDTPNAGQLDVIEVADGPLQHDLSAYLRRVGPGGLAFTGGGQVVFDGVPVAGEGRIVVQDCALELRRDNIPASDLPAFTATNAALTATFSHQFGSSCTLVLTGSTFDPGASNTHDIGDLDLDGATVSNPDATLRVHGPIRILSSSVLASHVELPEPDARINIAATQTLTAHTFDAAALALAGQGTIECGGVSGEVTVFDSLLRSAGDFGAINLQSRLEVPLGGNDATLDVGGDYAMTQDASLTLTLRDVVSHSKLAVGGAATLAGRLEVRLAPDATVATGDEFVLLNAGVLSGTFEEVAIDDPPAPGQTWSLIQDPAVGEVRLRLEGGSTAIEPAPESVARQLALRVAPNPFNPSTTVYFDLPMDGTVRIDVTDIQGRLVSTLVDDSMLAGSHAVQFDGRSASGETLPSGVYFIRMRLAAGELVRKVSLLQ